MNLLELQRRMAEDVRRPLTTDYQMQSVADDGTPVDEIAASYISPNTRLTSFERLEIYNRQYWFRLITAVSEDYPTLNAVLGPKRFDALILAYLGEHPSTSWTLRDLGAKLPAFLVAHPEFGGRHHRLAVDVANLELAYVDAFDGKQLSPLTEEEAQAIGADSRLCLQPHLRLLELAYPVDNLVLAVKKGMPEVDIVSSAATQRDMTSSAKIPPIKREAVFLAVHRYDDSVYYRRLEKEAFLLLKGLRSGVSVAVAVLQAFAKSKLRPDAQAILLQESLAHASQLGWLCPLNEANSELTELVM